MSYIDDLNQAATEALAASSSATDSAQIMFDVANGADNVTVTTDGGEVKTVAKAIKDIVDSIEAGVEAPQVEPQTLSGGQTTVTLTTMTTEGIALYIEGSREFDFTVTNDTDFELSQSFPDGTRIWIVKRDIEGTADSFTVNTSTGSQTLSNALDERVIWVNTIADLKTLAISALVDGQAAKITTTGRAGGFTWSAADLSTEVANDPEQGVYVAPLDDATGASGAWKRIEPPKSVDQFGGVYVPTLSKMRSGEPFEMANAVSEAEYEAILAQTSTTDHSALINSVLEDAKIAVLSPGLWQCDSGIIVPRHKQLAGRNPFRTYAPSITPLTEIQSVIKATHAGIGIQMSGGGNAVIGLSMKGNESLDCGIEVVDEDAKIQEFGMDGASNQGIRLLPATVACALSDIVVVNVMQGRSGFTGTIGGVDIDGTDHFLERVQANGESGFSTVVAGKQAVSLYLKGSNHFISNCIGEFGEIGIVFECSRSRAVNLRADKCMGDGYLVSQGVNSLTNAHAIECGTGAASTYDGFVVTGEANTITNAKVIRQGTSVLRYGINDTLQSNSEFNDWVHPTVESGAADTAFFENTFLGSAFSFPEKTFRYNTGTTFDVSGFTGLYLYHGDPVTVTAFTGAVNNQILRVHAGTANITIQDNSGISLTGGVSRNLNNNEIITLKRFNTVWYEI